LTDKKDPTLSNVSIVAIAPGITPWIRRIMPVAVSIGIYIVMPIGIIRSIRIRNSNHCALESVGTVIDPESTPTEDE
jgi:hypothetical protein